MTDHDLSDSAGKRVKDVAADIICFRAENPDAPLQAFADLIPDDIVRHNVGDLLATVVLYAARLTRGGFPPEMDERERVQRAKDFVNRVMDDFTICAVPPDTVPADFLDPQ